MTTNNAARMLAVVCAEHSVRKAEQRVQQTTREAREAHVAATAAQVKWVEILLQTARALHATAEKHADGRLSPEEWAEIECMTSAAHAFINEESETTRPLPEVIRTASRLYCMMLDDAMKSFDHA